MVAGISYQGLPYRVESTMEICVAIATDDYYLFCFFHILCHKQLVIYYICLKYAMILYMVQRQGFLLSITQPHMNTKSFFGLISLYPFLEFSQQHPNPSFKLCTEQLLQLLNIRLLSAIRKMSSTYNNKLMKEPFLRLLQQTQPSYRLLEQPFLIIQLSNRLYLCLGDYFNHYNDFLNSQT